MVAAPKRAGAPHAVRAAKRNYPAVALSLKQGPAERPWLGRLVWRWRSSPPGPRRRAQARRLAHRLARWRGARRCLLAAAAHWPLGALIWVRRFARSLRRQRSPIARLALALAGSAQAPAAAAPLSGFGVLGRMRHRRLAERVQARLPRRPIAPCRPGPISAAATVGEAWRRRSPARVVRILVPAPRRLRRSGLSQPRRSWRESGSKQAEPIEAAGLGLGRPQVRFPADPQAPAHRWCPRCRVLGFRTLDFLLARPRPDGRRSWARWHWRGRGPARAPAAAGPNRPWRRRRCTCIPPSRARVGATALSGQQGSGQSSYHEISFKNICLSRRGSRGCAVS